MISVIAYLYVKPEKREEAVKAAEELISKVKNEEGTLYYSFNADDNDSETFVFMEKYKDMESLKLHGQTEYFSDFMKKAQNFSSKPPEIKTYTEISSI
ncbi:MAG: putative quinol monooxygenase [Thermodesulfobacteriota bacterium]